MFEKLSRRLHFGHFPTPLERLDRLSAYLNGPTVWIKRDDCTGLSLGGNKTRKLEFIMPRAIESGADTIITCGALQSNHARQTSAIAAKLGLNCYLLLRENPLVVNPDFRHGGNLLLDAIHDARIIRCSGDTDLAVELEKLAASLKEKGMKPFVIPGGGSDLFGTLGYVNAAIELSSQAHAAGVNFVDVILATGSGGTHAGLVAGFCLLGRAVPVRGISVGPTRADIEPAVFALATAAAHHVGPPCSVARSKIVVDDSYLGGGYGVVNDAVVEAVQLVARLEGILLDPVYTGKAMSGLIALIRAGRYKKSDHVVFIHTGGAPALFPYEAEMVASHHV